jgi:hypothetical protein
VWLVGVVIVDLVRRVVVTWGGHRLIIFGWHARHKTEFLELVAALTERVNPVAIMPIYRRR